MRTTGLLISLIFIVISCSQKINFIRNSKEVISQEYDKLIVNDSIDLKIAIIHAIENVNYNGNGKLNFRDMKILKLLDENHLENKNFFWVSDFQFGNNKNRKICFIYRDENINLDKYYPKYSDWKPLYWYKKGRKGNFIYFQGIFNIKNHWISIIQYANLKYQPYYEGEYNTGKEFDSTIKKIETALKINQ
jgi:hypothetical protein